MAYLHHTSWKDRPGAVAGVIAIHGLIGYALVTGLTLTGIVDTVGNPQSIFVPDVKLPPPPPPPKATVEPDPKLVTPPIHVPLPPIDLGPQRPVIDTAPLVLPSQDLLPKVVPSATPGPAAQPAFDPVSAKPRNDPGSWVTEADYRSSWINREMAGTARFRLEIGASGKVEGCTITGSSGHPELDKATCDLVTRRANFAAAKNASGAKTDGAYASSVRWQIPD